MPRAIVRARRQRDEIGEQGHHEKRRQEASVGAAQCPPHTDALARAGVPNADAELVLARGGAGTALRTAERVIEREVERPDEEHPDDDDPERDVRVGQ